MRAWLDVTAGVAGDMLMGAFVDAGADLDQVRAAIAAVAGDDVVTHREAVTRAGLAATQLHVDIAPTGAGRRPWADVRRTVELADLHPSTRSRALAVLESLVGALSRGHALAPEDVAWHEIAALDLLADVVGDCEAVRSLGIEAITASPVALGSGRIRTSLGDREVPMPAVAALASGWPVWVPEGDAPAEQVAPRERAPLDRYVPAGELSGDGGLITEGPAPVVGPGLGELATPTGMALLRTLAARCEPRPDFEVRVVGVGAGGRDVPGRPNVVRVLLG